MSVVSLPIDADITVRYAGMHRASQSFGDDTVYVTSGVAGTVSLKDADGTTVTSTTSWTHVEETDGTWYVTLNAQALTEGAEYTIEIDITSPVDDYRKIYCVANYRGQ